MKKHTIFVGLDVHKDSIDIAFAEDGRDGEVRYYGTICEYSNQNLFLSAPIFDGDSQLPALFF